MKGYLERWDSSEEVGGTTHSRQILSNIILLESQGTSRNFLSGTEKQKDANQLE